MSFAFRLAALVLVLMTLASPAVADNSAARADRLFEQGKQLMKENRLVEACPKLEESQRLERAPGTLLALAYCREQLGLLASAHATYLEAAKLAEDAEQDDRVLAARKRAAALQLRLSTLAFVVPEGLSQLTGFELRLNSTLVEHTTWQGPLPLDHGMYTIEVSAPGFEPWRTSIVLRDEGQRHVVTIPKLEPVQSAITVEDGPTPALPGKRVALPARNFGETAPGTTRGSHEKTWTLATGIGSVVSLGAGAALGLRAISKNEQSNSAGHCDSRGCDPRGLALRQDALTAARFSTGLFVLGGALAVTSLTLYLTTGAHQNPTQVTATSSTHAVGLDATVGF